MDKKLIRSLILLAATLGTWGMFTWVAALIINLTPLKPEGYKCRMWSHFFFNALTFGIYGLVASICSFSFDPNKEKNIGYVKA